MFDLVVRFELFVALGDFGAENWSGPQRGVRSRHQLVTYN